MSKSPVHPKYETSDYGCYEFDPHLNFSQFLEEARQPAGDINFQRSSSCSKHVGKIKLGGHKKNKKQCKISLFFSWWKFDSKDKSTSDPVERPNLSKGSGQLLGTATENDPPCRRHAMSGPVSILFNPTKVMENEVPYMSLEQPNHVNQINTYGPVYLVT